ncbi:TPA: hypothetical protein GX533_01810 [Candidatus Dojkabacteria bacterium]|uniref:Uncharacterized protein n=1 Tax=Candidatus Dojkabacteria bacterium TaxID=2099670 RepID=A0A832QDG9_9BACT|nr:hypothetical protein [Candidatus Dojkabacteria bacterium]
MGKIKTFLTVLVFIVITGFSGKYTYAQENIIQLDQEETIESVKEVENLETEEQEDTKTVETKEQTEVPQFPFGTILLAILIPSILIIIAYLIFKFIKF